MFDQHVQKHEELKHRLHAERREQARAGDGTIEQGENELARIRAIKHRNEIAALKAANDDLKRQLAEAQPAAAEWENYCESQAQRHEVRS